MGPREPGAPKSHSLSAGLRVHPRGERGRAAGKGAYLVVPVALAVTLWGRERGGESAPQHPTCRPGGHRASLGSGEGVWEAGPGVGVSSATQGAPGRSAIEAGCLWGREGRSETKGHGPQAGAPAQGRRGRQAPRPSALRAGLGAAGAGRGRGAGPLGKTRAGPAGASREGAWSARPTRPTRRAEKCQHVGSARAETSYKRTLVLHLQ